MAAIMFVVMLVLFHAWNYLGYLFLKIPPVFQQPEITAGLLAIAFAIETKK